MKTPWEIKIGNIAQYMAIGSFTIGTLLLILKFILKDYIIVIGIYFVAMAILVNLLYLIIMIISLFFADSHHEYIIKKGLMMLANIPIAILYFFVVIKLI